MVLISAVAVAVSLTVAGVVLYQRDAPFNMMSWPVSCSPWEPWWGCGDRRRGRRAPNAGDGRRGPPSPWSIIRQITVEMRSAILFSAVMAAIVLVPAFFLEGEAGRS